MRIAVLQGQAFACAPELNLATLLEIAIKAKKSGADLILAPEYFISGVLLKETVFLDGTAASYNNYVHELAARLKDAVGVPIVVGAPHFTPSGQMFSGAFLVHDGQAKLICTRKNTQSPFWPSATAYTFPGDGPEHLEINGYNFLVSLGNDIQSLPDNLLQKKIDAILHLDSRPFQQIDTRCKTEITQQYPTLSANLFGMAENIILNGKSRISDAGKTFTMPAFEPCLWFADLKHNHEKVYIAAITGPGTCNQTTQAEEQKNIYPSYSAHTGKDVVEHTKTSTTELWEALVFGTQHFVAQSGFKKVVLGLSGGIDSALVLCIAVEAFGAQNVHAILLPSPYSSTGSIEHSLQLAQNLGVSTSTAPIGELMDTYSNTYSHAFGEKPSGLGEENMQARIRGSLLMLYANTQNALLLTTGNKSELATGYCTLYGDMAGALAVIGDLYKTQVVEICRWYNAHYRDSGKVIPEIIITKPPSAELRPDQLDSDSLPDYHILDSILKLHLEAKLPAKEIISKGYDAPVVERILTLLRRSEFKRRQAAPVLSLSHSCFGVNISYPL